MPAAKYRKKPVVISAVQFDGNNRLPLIAALGMNQQDTRIGDGGGLLIQTPEGELLAKPGDWIIKGIKGEFYPCSDDIFKATYEAVEE